MDNKKTLWVVLGIIVVVGIIWAVVSYNNSQNAALVGNTTTTPTPAPTPVATTPSANGNPAYDAALLKYGKNRIQFQENCQALPVAGVFKNGTTIMLDNRASVSHAIKFDSKTYTLGAYDFTTVTLSSSVLPHKIAVDCDKSQNVTTITIEK
ncbi:MAG: hypothetical protein WDN47_03390 [Candidatus Doudnabacteria bacterium]